jgi:hypothetical protein
MINKNSYIVFCFFISTNIMCMENNSQKRYTFVELETDENKRTERNDILIDLKEIEGTNVTPDPRNEGDYSIWYEPLYPFAERFVNKKGAEVEGVLSELVAKEDFKVLQKNTCCLKELRDLISRHAKFEEYKDGSIYLTCAKDKAVELKTKLEDETKLIKKVMIYSLKEKNYDQQREDLELKERRQKGQRLVCCSIGTYLVGVIICVSLLIARISSN